MPLTLSILRAAGLREPKPVSRSLTEARSRGMRTVFLCHSHRDAELVKGLVTLLSEAGWTAYVDWADTQMPAAPSRQTALRIQQRIKELDLFLYLATPTAAMSRWCPWEIGFANGEKPIDSIIVCPTSDGTTTHGAEYLDLYRRLDLSDRQQLAVWQPGDSSAGVLVAQL